MTGDTGDKETIMTVELYTTIENTGVSCRYGVPVAPLGEDGGDGRWVSFTHDVRRGIAAVLADVRGEWGGRVKSLTLEKAEWWRLRANCGCGDTCPHGDEACWDDEEGLCDPTLPPCGDVYSWAGEGCSPDAPGAAPVMVWEVVPW